MDVDIAVIGGGIHGVGVAQAAAAAGYQTALFEQQYLAYGTSRWSSKLIHGGLRYLESLEIGLVRESLRERELLLKLAPELVTRCDFHIPIYRETKRRPWLVRTGLCAYTLLAGCKKNTGFSSVPARQWGELDGLNTENLQTVFRYSDAQTDDAQLTWAVMNSAQQLGAQLFCPAQVQNLHLMNDHVRIEYQMGKSCNVMTARAVVNACGPWVNQLLDVVNPALPALPIELVGGTHIELPEQVSSGCYYLEVPADRRAVFVLPWKDRTLVGTTENSYRGDPALVSSSMDSVDYLLSVYRQFFPDNDDTVLAHWSGLRVLPKSFDSAFKRSREIQLPVDCPHQPKLVSIVGGKLTGYRSTALKVMDVLAPSLPKVKRRALTSELPLLANDYDVVRNN